MQYFLRKTKLSDKDYIKISELPYPQQIEIFNTRAMNMVKKKVDEGQKVYNTRHKEKKDKEQEKETKTKNLRRSERISTPNQGK